MTVTLLRLVAVRRRWPPTALLRVFAGFGVVLALWVIVVFVLALPAGFDDPSGFYRVKVRIATPLGDHNTAAGLLLPGIAATAFAATHDRRWLAALPVTTLGLAATLSRGAAAVLLLVVVATWPVIGDHVARLRLLAAAGAALVLIVLAAALLGATPPGDASEVRGPVGESVVARIDLIRRGVSVGAAHPLAGAGLRSFADHAADLPPPHHHAHNAVVHAFAEGGLLLAGVAVGMPLVLAWRLRRALPGPVRDAALLGGAGLVLQAQHDILGGLAGYEVVLAALVSLAGAAGAGHRPGGHP